MLRTDDINTFKTEDYYANGPYARSKAVGDMRSRVYGLDSVNERAAGAPRNESEEHIIEMKGLGTVGPNDYAKHPNGSETVSWAQSEGRTESDVDIKGNYIQKTTDVVIEKENR